MVYWSHTSRYWLHTKMWELDLAEHQRIWCFWIVALEKTVESPLDGKEIQPVHPRGNQPWMFIGRTDVKAEAPILWPPGEELTHWKRCWKRLRVGEEGGDRGWDGWMSTTHSMDMSLSNFWEIVKDREAWRAAVHGVTKSQIPVSNWKTTTMNSGH